MPSADARPLEVRADGAPTAAADTQPDQEHGEDQREGVDRRAKQQREDARPDHFAPSAVMPESAIAT